MKVFGRFIDEERNNCKRIGNVAFEDFTRWRKRHKIQCSVKRTSFWRVYRPSYGAFLNSKAYNARILTEWILDLVIRVRQFPQPQWTVDARLPLCEAALKPGQQPDSRIRGRKFFESPRRGISRYFGLTERASRNLFHGYGVGLLWGSSRYINMKSSRYLHVMASSQDST